MVIVNVFIENNETDMIKQQSTGKCYRVIIYHYIGSINNDHGELVTSIIGHRIYFIVK